MGRGVNVRKPCECEIFNYKSRLLVSFKPGMGSCREDSAFCDHIHQKYDDKYY